MKSVQSPSIGAQLLSTVGNVARFIPEPHVALAGAAAGAAFRATMSSTGKVPAKASGDSSSEALENVDTSQIGDSYMELIKLQIAKQEESQLVNLTTNLLKLDNDSKQAVIRNQRP